jgi:hydrogenase maturation protease
MSTDQQQLPSIRIIGCGRSLRCDDRIGLMIAEALRSTLAAIYANDAHVAIETTEAPSAEQCAMESDPDGLLIIIDAARATESVKPGTWTRIDYHDRPDRIGEKCRTNTHTLSVDAALETAAALGLLPKTVWVYAVAGKDFGYGEELSPGLHARVPELVTRIADDVRDWLANSAHD